MPKKIADQVYECSFCGKRFDDKDGKGIAILNATGCENGHNIVYFPITREEIRALIQFIFTGEEKLIPEALYKRLMKYNNRREVEI